MSLGQALHVCAQNDLATKKYVLLGEQAPSCLAWAQVRDWSPNWAFSPVSKSAQPAGVKLPNPSHRPTNVSKIRIVLQQRCRALEQVKTSRHRNAGSNTHRIGAIADDEDLCCGFQSTPAHKHETVWVSIGNGKAPRYQHSIAAEHIGSGNRFAE